MNSQVRVMPRPQLIDGCADSYFSTIVISFFIRSGIWVRFAKLRDQLFVLSVNWLMVYL